MKKKFLTVLAFLAVFNYAGAQNHLIESVENPVDFVNPLMGTDSSPGLSNGNTYPAVAVPWGMNLWTPQTGPMGHGWAYTYNADKIRGFKQTHQPSPWMNDYGQFSLMPVTGGMKFNQDDRASWFSHKAEESTPYYYKVYLADHDVTVELTPTERAAQFKMTFPKSDSSYVVIDPFDKGSYVKVIPEENKIIGYTTKYARGKLTNFKNYFVIEFDKPFSDVNTWEGDKLAKGQAEMEADHAGAIVGFDTKDGAVVNAKVASSFISFEQAQLNLDREIAKDDFETTKQNARDNWNEKLGILEVSGGTIDQVRTFYSCLYRTLFFPNKLYEINKNDEIVHWSPYNGEILPGYMFAGTGFWDTFRALYPFLNLAYPSINKEMQAGLANDYKEGGWLPEWSSPGYANIMVGNNSASVVADAYIKGLRGYDTETLWDALVNGANNEGPMSAVGRAGAPYYNKLGYVPYDVGVNESAARTLEYAYDDFAIYQFGKAIGKPKKEIKIYAERSMNYKNLFDPSYGLMRGKNEDGSWQEDFNPFKWGNPFTEGNSWHYSWSVFHDVEGLIGLMGGKEDFVKKLDSVFSMPPIFDESVYGGVIHEIREMQIADMGQYAHGNQPIQHMIYLYNYAGEPWKTQKWARETMDRMYKATPDGYCGDEDNGQTSAWYVFSALGFYPVTPAVDEYVMGAPLFKKITVNLENGNKIEINAPKNSDDNKYIESMKVDGKSYNKNYLKHSDLVDGATINIEMSDSPNKDRGTKKDAFPYSFSNE
ncbi:GH92 family glycosyl hydrolase [Zunongwangia sp. SCSIO 43204]|uniref:GH92 family glycosyl hydrolase n=1 Tax=Zunongwangia sp. SCSIO 43204 TaxID=2779359 RepID=UPI001CA961F5|nr:GH92 family glycosyl hydrolase [Zunongwangia sp. SCSIO 43204]UAB83455.1 GH92 family glycosyl hydrolase [Zunongwangia sp. SCSIO 43204]